MVFTESADCDFLLKIIQRVVVGSVYLCEKLWEMMVKDRKFYEGRREKVTLGSIELDSIMYRKPVFHVRSLLNDH